MCVLRSDDLRAVGGKVSVNASETVVRALLQYLYVGRTTGTVQIAKWQDALSLFELAHMHELHELVSSVAGRLSQLLTVHNVFVVLQSAVLRSNSNPPSTAPSATTSSSSSSCSSSSSASTNAPSGSTPTTQTTATAPPEDTKWSPSGAAAAGAASAGADRDFKTDTERMELCALAARRLAGAAREFLRQHSEQLITALSVNPALAISVLTPDPDTTASAATTAKASASSTAPAKPKPIPIPIE
jgi:hypothetical protein